MRRFHIDFAANGSHRSHQQWLLLGLVLLLFLTSAIYYRHLLSVTAALTAQYRSETELRMPARTLSADAKKNAAQLAQRLQSAHAIVERMSIPWVGLLGALEDAATDEVALLRVEPDVSHREVRLTVQTLKLSHAVSYAHKLMISGALTRVLIVSQRDMSADSSGTLQVILSGKWAADARPSSPQNGTNLPGSRFETVARTW